MVVGYPVPSAIFQRVLAHQELDCIGREGIRNVGRVPRVQPPHALVGQDRPGGLKAAPAPARQPCLRPATAYSKAGSAEQGTDPAPMLYTKCRMVH